METHQVRTAAEQLLRNDPGNVPAICEAGAMLASMGCAAEARRCYKQAVEGMKAAIRATQVDAALLFESMIYESFVKTEETEQHYYRCFSEWREDFARLGRRFRKPAPAHADPGTIAFVFLGGTVLGHTEVFFRMIEQLPAQSRAGLRLIACVVNSGTPAFDHRAAALGVEVIDVVRHMPNGAAAGLGTRIAWLREVFAEQRVACAVWMSTPQIATFALSLQLAPVQAFWAMRFHPVSGSFIDAHITYGAPEESTRRFGKQEWTVCPVPLALEPAVPPAEAVAALRSKLAPDGAPLLGTLAREDKINSAPFLDAVVRILTENPTARFLWTGREPHPAIAARFTEAGLAERCPFVGWVDTRLYAAALDLFLETWPLGCGITGYQAMAAGVPLLSFLERDTVFGMRHWHVLVGERPASGITRSELDSQPVLCAADADEYVAMAGRLIREPALRREAGAREKAFFEAEMAAGPAYAVRFMDTLRATIARKLPAVSVAGKAG